jgi:hypothetical protein
MFLVLSNLRPMLRLKNGKNTAFFGQTTASFCKGIISLVFEKKRQFFPPEIGKNRRKSCL